MDVATASLLLERIRPGLPLPGGDDAAAVGVAADLLRRLHAAAHSTSRFPPLMGACLVYEP